MAGHQNDLGEDDYDDLDDFIGDDDDGNNVVEEEALQSEEDEEQQLEEEEEVEEEEEEEPPAGQQEILSLREQLKAEARRKLYQANGANAVTKATCSSSAQAPVKNAFGNFFGPSTPSLARRVIEEGCSSIMKEIQNATSKKNVAPLAPKMQPNASSHQQKPKFVREEKTKADALRQNRDYSDVFSDDADVPPSTKEHQPDSRPVMPLGYDVEVRGPMQSSGKCKGPINHPAKLAKDHGSIQSRVQNKAGSQGKEPLPNGRKMIPATRNGASLPNTKKTPGLQSSSNSQKSQLSMQSKRPQTSPLPSQKQEQSSQIRRPLQQSSKIQRQQNNSAKSLQGRMNSLVQNQHPARKGSAQSHDRPKLAQKQLGPSSKPKPTRTNAAYDDHASKRRVLKRKCSEDEKAISMIRGMFNYNPEKYRGRDEDVSDIEADYASIQMEERRSAKLARKEDEEQLRLIEEEEKRERMKRKK